MPDSLSTDLLREVYYLRGEIRHYDAVVSNYWSFLIREGLIDRYQAFLDSGLATPQD